MPNNHFTYQITLLFPIERVYRALTQELGLWWGISHQGVKKVGDKITIGFEEEPFCWAFETSELLINKRIVLTCIDISLLHSCQLNSIQKEWQGSQLILELSDSQGQTDLNFIHRGLTPQLDCFEVCVTGWNHYLGKALNQYLETH